MPKLSESVTAVTPPPREEPKPNPNQRPKREKNYHRLYTVDEDSEEPIEWQYRHSKFEDSPPIDTGFNADGTIKTPDPPKIPGFDPSTLLFRWPDGSLRKEYPPRNKYVVAARKRWSEIAHFCRMKELEGMDSDSEEAEIFQHRFNVNVLWCAHARYMEKLHIHPEVRDDGEFYEFQPDSIDPLLDEENVVNEMLRKAGCPSVKEISDELDEQLERQLRERWKERREKERLGDAYRPKSAFINLNEESAGTRVDFQCEVLGKQSPIEPQTPTTGLDELE